VRLIARHGNVLEIEGVDVLDGTPLEFSSEMDASVSTRVVSWKEAAEMAIFGAKAMHPRAWNR
jgi:tRNA (Thr-GGU) A37 N-methylase